MSIDRNQTARDSSQDDAFDPSNARLRYSSATEVLHSEQLNHEQKYAVLSQWRVDLEQQSAAAAEGMEDSATEHGRQLREVAQALLRLDQSSTA